MRNTRFGESTQEVYFWNGQQVPDWRANYLPVQPVTQYQGTDPGTGTVRIYEVDARGYLVSRLNEDTHAWMSPIGGAFSRPADLKILLGEPEKAVISEELKNRGVVADKKTYIVFGDEPKTAGFMVINLKSQMSSESYRDLKTLFSQFPRTFLYQWFLDNVYPSLPPMNTFAENRTDVYGNTHVRRVLENEIWAAFVNVFNEANLEILTALTRPLNNDTFWKWEQEKLEKVYAVKAESETSATQNEFASFISANTPVDAEAQELVDEYSMLPPLGDPGLELSRQNAFNELLKLHEYEAVRGLLAAYKYADTIMLSSALRAPIHTDLVTNDGRIVHKTQEV